MASEWCRLASQALRTTPSLLSSRPSSRFYSQSLALQIAKTCTYKSLPPRRFNSNWTSPSAARPDSSFDDTTILKPTTPTEAAPAEEASYTEATPTEAASTASPEAVTGAGAAATTTTAAGSPLDSYLDGVGPTTKPTYPGAPAYAYSAPLSWTTALDNLSPANDHDYTPHIQKMRKLSQADLGGQARHPTHDLPLPPEPKVWCKPRTGRSVQVRQPAMAAYAVQVLNQQCAANRVRSDFQSQRYHERPGLKRKRLRTERWRKRFKGGFKAICYRVDHLRRQGW